MAITTFDGPIRSLGGIFQQGPSNIVTITSSTTLNPTDHAGRIVAVGGTLAANVVLTLPTINTSANPASSGPGNDPNTQNNQGVVYTIWVPTTIATSSLKIGTDGTDKFIGTILGVDTDSSNALVAYTAGASDDFGRLYQLQRRHHWRRCRYVGADCRDCCAEIHGARRCTGHWYCSDPVCYVLNLNRG